MPIPSVYPALRLSQGGTDPYDIEAAFQDIDCARVVALSHNADTTVRVVAALAGGLPALVNSDKLRDPHLERVIHPLIGTAAGSLLLKSLAQIAPAGWGADMAHDLRNAVRSGTCSPVAAASLIGPSDEAAQLLEVPRDIAQVIKRWGRDDSPFAPAWHDRVSKETRNRFLGRLLSSRISSIIASCLPFLPLDMIDRARGSIVADSASALDSFADASVVVRRSHVELIRECIRSTCIHPQFDQFSVSSLFALTRIARAMPEVADDAWDSVVAFMSHRYEFIKDVLAAAHWDELPEHVRQSLLRGLDPQVYDHGANVSDAVRLCSAVHAARGNAITTPQTARESVVFFAALNPHVWQQMDKPLRRAWRTWLHEDDVYLAVRSLGPDPEVMASASLSNNVIAALDRFSLDESEKRWALFPLALRRISVDAAMMFTNVALPSPLPPPSKFDRNAFVMVASGDPDVSLAPPMERACLDALPDRAACASVIALQRISSGRESIQSSISALCDIFSSSQHHGLGGYLPNHLQAIIAPDVNDLAKRLARPDRIDAMQRALTSVCALPPEIAAPALFALREAGNVQREKRERVDAAHYAANCLLHLSNVAFDVADALCDDVRPLFFPLPDHAPTVDALRDLARHDASIAFLLAHALHGRRWRDVARCVIRAPLHAPAFLSSIPDDVRSAMLDDIVQSAPMKVDDHLRALWRQFVNHHPLPAIALTLLSSDDPVERNNATSVLAEYADADVVRSFLRDMGLDIKRKGQYRR